MWHWGRNEATPSPVAKVDEAAVGNQIGAEEEDFQQQKATTTVAHKQGTEEAEVSDQVVGEETQRERREAVDSILFGSEYERLLMLGFPALQELHDRCLVAAKAALLTNDVLPTQQLPTQQAKAVDVEKKKKKRVKKSAGVAASRGVGPSPPSLIIGAQQHTCRNRHSSSTNCAACNGWCGRPHALFLHRNEVATAAARKQSCI